VDAARVTAQVVVAHPGRLGFGTAHVGHFDAEADGDVRSPHGFQELGQQSPAVEGPTVVGDHQFDVQFGALQQQAQGPGIVDVIADVGVEDDRDFLRLAHGVASVWSFAPFGTDEGQEPARAEGEPPLNTELARSHNRLSSIGRYSDMNLPG